MRALIRHGASVNVKDSDGRTPLSLAAGRGDLLVCNLLLDEGAALEIKVRALSLASYTE
jgi:ankyrin repeat protein